MMKATCFAGVLATLVVLQGCATTEKTSSIPVLTPIKNQVQLAFFTREHAPVRDVKQEAVKKVASPIREPLPREDPRWANVPRLWPFDEEGWEIISPYGPRSGRVHKGVDIKAPSGTSVKATASGVVAFSGQRGGYGNVVILDHENGYETTYAHLSRRDVVEGQSIGAGEIVGSVGATGNASCPHVHYEVRERDEAIDPSVFLPAVDDTLLVTTAE